MADERFGIFRRRQDEDVAREAALHPETPHDLVTNIDDPNDPSPLTRLYISRFARRLVRRSLIVVLLVVMVSMVGVLRAEDAANEAEKAASSAEEAVGRVEQESIDRQVQSCERANEFRAFLRDDYARRGEPLDAEGIRSTPEYQALPNNVRPFVDALILSIETDRDSAAAQGVEYEAQFPIVDCAALRSDLEAELAAAHQDEDGG